jgi:hypothetical protein
VCGNCERLDLECEQSDASIWRTTDSHSVTPCEQLEEPSLLDMFQSELNVFDQPTHNIHPSSDGASSNLISRSVPAETCSPSETVSLTSETAVLLETYVQTVATWMDIFDHRGTYQLHVPQLVLKSPLLLHCVCAFTANHLELSNASSNSSWKFVAVKHYGEALRLLIHALSIPAHEHALTASMILLSYEIHDSLRSEDYRRHFLGLTTLIRSRNITAQSTGTDRANFWIYVRHEIVLAISSERPLLLDPAEWSVSWIEGESREDVLGNQVIWILARVVNLIFGKDGKSAAGKTKREKLLREIEVWRLGLSETFLGIPYGDKEQNGFRRVYFPVTAAAAAAFWYHVCHILLVCST